MRLFIAIELPEEARRELSRWQDIVRRAISCRASWTKPENLHVTLKFIGEMDDNRADAIRAAIGTVSAASVPLAVERLAQLPPRGPARVIAAHVMGDLSELHSKVESALDACSVARDGRPYRPHITLARVRERARIDMDRIDFPRGSATPFEPRRFVLMQSQLSAQGPKYTVLERYPLLNRGRSQVHQTLPAP